MNRVLNVAVAYLFSVLAALTIASSVSTQFVLAKLGDMGIRVPFTTRLETTFLDIVGAAPVFATMTGIAFLAAFLIGAFVINKLKAPHSLGYALAGACGMFTAGFASSQLLGATLIAGSRGAGIAGFIVAGGVGGWLFARLIHRRMRH